MFKINKVDCTIKPKKFESLNNGIWYYNFDIESEVVLESVMGNKEDQHEVTRYKYGQVIPGYPLNVG